MPERRVSTRILSGASGRGGTRRRSPTVESRGRTSHTTGLLPVRYPVGAVRNRCLEGFKKQAAELIRITQEKETHTLRYDWFLSLDGTECEVREAYTDPEGLIEHNRNILEARTKLFEDYADDHFMTFYGEVSEPLLNLLKTHSVGYM